MQPFKSFFSNNIGRYYAFNFFREFAFFSAVLVPFFTDWGHISLTRVQILQSWFMLWVFLLEIPTGVIADRFGRKLSLLLGSLMVSFTVILYGSLPRFEIFLLGEFLFAVAIALFSGADDALLYDSLKEIGQEKESKKIFGRAYSFRLFGMLISAPIGSFLASRLGLNFPMILSAIPFFLAGLVAWTIKEPVVHQETSESKRYFDIAKKGFSFFRHHKPLRSLAFDAILVATAAYFVVWLYQPLLIQLDVPIFYFGFLHAALVGVEMLIAANFVFLERIFRSGKTYLRFTAIATGLTFLSVAAFPSILTATLFIVFAGGFGMTRMELMSTYMNKFIPSAQRATILSFVFMVEEIILVILNPVVGFTADHSLRLAFFMVGLLPLAVFLLSSVKQEMLEGEPAISN